MNVLEKRNLRKNTSPTRDELKETGGKKKMHNAKPYNLHYSANITPVNKLRRMMDGAYGVYMKENRCV